MENNKKKNWFTALFTDADWDFDLSKVVGFICVTCAIVGFFLDKGDYLALLGFGAGLLGISKIKGD